MSRKPHVDSDTIDAFKAASDGSLASAQILLFYQFYLASKFVWFCIVRDRSIKNPEMVKASLKSLIKEPEATNNKITAREPLALFAKGK